MTILAMPPIWNEPHSYSNDTTPERLVSGDAVVEAVEPVTVGAGDDAQLSAAGELLSVEMDGSAVRWEKIARLREQIAAGTYRVSSQEIAGKMIDAMML
jgi:flagellar biosynthesis anti-sigma factor FlgM